MVKLKNWLEQLDWGYLVVFLMCLFAIWPFISRSALPQETDAELHIFRLAELSRMISLENLYPRWSSNFYFGFGYPIFNYYAPLSYYLGLIATSAFSLGAVAGVKFVFIVSLFAAGIGMYGYSRDNWGRSSGLVASAAYLFAPYLLFIDPHARGDLAETLSLGIFPLALWSLDRLRSRPSALNWVLSVITAGFLILSHNLMGLLLFAFLVAWSIWQHLTKQVSPPPIKYKNVLSIVWKYRLLVALVLATGVTAFFWLPVILERDAVELGSVVGQGGHFDFHNHFLTFGELLSPNKIIDWGATEPDFRFNLGLVQWILGVLAVIMFALNKTRNRQTVTFFLLTLLLYIILMLPLSTFLWENVPYMAFIQFPWRFLGPAAASLAIVSGIGVGALVSFVGDKAGRYVEAASLGLIMFSALPLIQVTPWPVDFGPTTPLRVLEIELSGRWLGTTSTADFLPATVEIDPRPEPTLVESYYSGSSIDRINRSTLRSETEVSSELINPTHQRFKTVNDDPFLLRLYLFNFPGWKATIDGSEVPIEIGRPEGFIVIPVPAGSHTIDLEFQSTNSRTMSSLISLLSALVTGLITVVIFMQSKESHVDDNDSHDSVRTSFSSVLPSVILTVAVMIIQIVGGDQYNWFNIESTGNIALPAQTTTEIHFEDAINLIGYSIKESSLSSGDALELTLFWKIQNPQKNNYQVFVHLLDSNSQIVAQSDKLNPGDFPTERWPKDKYVRDTHMVEMPEGVSPGQYWIEVGLWTAGDSERLTVLDKNREVSGDTFRLPQPVIIQQ